MCSFASKGYSLAYLKGEAEVLMAAVTRLKSPVTLCHNDLLLGNIIWHQGSSSVHFIDFEYAAANYQPFDVANHFCEFAGTCQRCYN